MTAESSDVAAAAPTRGSASFESWYSSEGPRLLRALSGLCADRHVAEELLAESCARTWARWERVADPTGYTYRIAVNLLRRRRPRSRDGSQRSEAIERPLPDPDLWAAVAELPRRQREVVALRYLADLTEADIAAVLGISVGATSTHLSRARAALRARLEETHRA